MVIIETPIFTQRIQAVLSEEEYRLLQIQLVDRPDSGKIIRGSGGLRKLRWAAGGHGKRGASGSFIIGLCRMLPFFSCLFFPRVSRRN